MSDERQELLEQANEMGLDFHTNIPNVKLKALIADSQNPAVEAPVQATEEPVVDPVAAMAKEAAAKNKPIPPKKDNSLRERIRVSKGKAMKLSVVTITNKDNRENDVMTTAPLSFENQYFGLARNVPLDIPVELEQGLIEVAESVMMTLHKDEIIQGKRTGNKVPVTVKKYAVSYGKPEA